MKKLYWCEFENGRKMGPRQLSPFPAAGMVNVDNTEIALTYLSYGETAKA